MTETIALPLPSFDHRFLECYVQDFVFEHFHLARRLFTNEPDLKASLTTSADLRRLVLINFLRLHCHQVREEQAFRPGASAHLQKVSILPDAWGLSKQQLLNLVSFTNNLCTASLYFASRMTYMFNDSSISIEYGLFKEYPKDQFVAVFCVPQAENDLIPGHNRFVFTLSFKTSTKKDTYLLRNRHEHDGLTRKGRTLRYWSISECPTEYVWPSQYADQFKQSNQTRIHEHDHPKLRCILFRCHTSLPPENDSRKSPDRTRSDSEQDKPVILEYVDADEVVMLKNTWWRPFANGRDREVFEGGERHR